MLVEEVEIMKLKVLAVRDNVADVFANPIFTQNIGIAVRSFGDEVKRPHSEERPNPLNNHPTDFDLYHLGDFDDETGRFEMLEIPSKVAAAKDYVS